MSEKVIIKRMNNSNLNYRMNYLANLVTQYSQAVNTKVDFKSQTFISEFEAWIKERKKQLSTYKDLLDHLNYDYNSKMTAEIGKGGEDSIVIDNCKKDSLKLDIPKTTIITPYSYGLKEITKGKNKIIKGKIEILKTEDSQDNINLDYYDIDSILTHNPYSNGLINNWDRIHNQFNYGVAIGVYGKNKDNDKEEKLQMLKSFKEKLNDFKDEYAQTLEDYFYIVTSPSEKIKLKNKVIK